MSEVKSGESDCSARWLTRREEIATAEDAELRRSLLTPDGMGREFKRACLDELCSRAGKQNGEIPCEQ
jgi:hypothetical protein